MDKFLLAENPMTGNDVCIIHTIEPKAMIEVKIGHNTTGNVFSKHYRYTNSVGNIELYTFNVFHYFTQDFNEENHNSSVSKLMDKAWQWYISYLKWEDAKDI